MRANLCPDGTGIVLGSKIDEVGECPERFGDLAGGVVGWRCTVYDVVLMQEIFQLSGNKLRCIV